MITSQLVWEQVWGLVLELIRHQPSDLTQGMCLQQSLAVWCAGKPKLALSLVLWVLAAQLQQSACRKDRDPLPLKWPWNRGHAATPTYPSWWRLLQCYLCYLAWLLSALQNWYLAISLGSIAGTVISQLCALMLLTVKRSKRPVHQCAAVLWESYSCCFVRLEILLDMLQSPCVWVTIGRELLQMSRTACEWRRWWYASWCVYLPLLWHASFQLLCVTRILYLQISVKSVLGFDWMLFSLLGHRMNK